MSTTAGISFGDSGNNDSMKSEGWPPTADSLFTNSNLSNCLGTCNQSAAEAAATTTIPNSASSRADFYRHLERSLWVWMSPFIFVLGMMGNALILAVMRRRRMRGTTTSVYLPLIALTDILVLICGIIPEYLEAALSIKFKELHPVTCKLEKFSFYTMADTSIWILVLFTFDRFVAVVLPLKKKTVCQPRRALIASGVVLLCAITKNFHVFWTRGPEFTQGPNGTMVLKRNCGRPTAAYRYFEFYIRPWIAFALVNAVPFVALLVFNIAIIKYLAIAMRARRSNTEGQNASDKGFTQTVAMCLSASFTFLICMTPSMVLLIGRPYWSNNNPAYNIAKAVNNQLAYVNHSANIFLYCATGKRFRTELMTLLRCHSNKKYNAKGFMQRKDQDSSGGGGQSRVQKSSFHGKGSESRQTTFTTLSPDTNGSTYTFPGTSQQKIESST